MAQISTGQFIAEVTRKEYITDHFIRVYLYSPEVYLFKNTTIGDNNKIAVPPAGLNEVYFPMLDENHEWVYPSKEVAPSIRTYTHRELIWKRMKCLLILQIMEMVAQLQNGQGKQKPGKTWYHDAPGWKKAVS